MKKILVLVMLSLTMFASASVDLNVTIEDKQEILDFQEISFEKDTYNVDGCFC